MSNAGIVFDLIGNDKSASKALDGVKDTGKKVAGAVGAAFAGMALGDVITKSMDNEKVVAKFKAGLGQTPEIAAKAGKLAGRLYQDGMGGSLEEVLGAVDAVGVNMVDLSAISEPELQKISTGALDIASVMGVDVVDVTRAAGQMMRNGLAPDAQTAFDIIATGATNGANRSGDLLETFTEYGPTFLRLGLDGQTGLGMIKSGLDNGILDSDRAAVAFEDFYDLVTAGGTPAIEAITDLGLNADDMAKKIAAGGPTAKAATGEIMTALSSLTDPQKKQTDGVALFGETWVTSGAAAVLAMNPVAQKTVDVKGKTTEMGDVLRDTAANKVDKIQRSFDGWITKMVETKGPMGDVMAAAVGLGPQIVSFAGSIGMVVVGLKSLGIGAAGSIMAATAPLWPLVAAIAAIGVVVKTVMDNIGRMSQQLEAAKNGDWTTASSIRSPAATFGVGSWMSPVGGSSGRVTPPSVYTGPAYNARGTNINPGRTYKLASGGIVMPRAGGTNAIIGEAGEAEAVIPLSKLSSMAGGMGGGVTINVQGIVAGTADEFARKLTDLLESARRRGTIA